MKMLQSTAGRVVNIFLIIVSALLSVVLIINLVLIVKAEVNETGPPSIFGFTPLVVLSGSMVGENTDSFGVDDMVIIKSVNAKALAKNDVIAFREGSSVIIHRIVRLETDEAGETVFVTRGDANNTEDINKVTQAAVLGKYESKLVGMGGVVTFFQSPVGMLVSVGLPIALFGIFDYLSGKREKARERKTPKTET